MKPMPPCIISVISPPPRFEVRKMTVWERSTRRLSPRVSVALSSMPSSNCQSASLAFSISSKSKKLSFSLSVWQAARASWVIRGWVAVAEVARRGANELGNLVGVLKFRAIYLDNRAGIPKQDLRRRFDDAGLSRARRPEKEEVSYGAARRVQSGTEDLVHVDQGLYTFLLANNLGAQGSMKIPRIVAAYGWVQLVAESSSHRLPLLRV